MKTWFATALSVLALGVWAPPALSQVELKFSHAYTADDARHDWAENIAQRVAEKTGGAVKIAVYPNQQLFKAKAQLQGLVQNRIDMAIYPLPWLSGKAPVTEIGALPGVVTTPSDGVAWRQRKIWPMLEEAVASTGVILAGGGWAMGTIGNSGATPILLPGDMAGHKMRGLGKATEIMMQKNGATITSLPAAEIYQGLQTGVLTGVLTIYESFAGFNLHEVIDHLLVGRGFVGAMHAVLVADGVKAKVGAENYQHLLDAVAESEEWVARRMEAESQRIGDDFAKRGVKVHKLSDQQVDAWLADAKRTAWTYFTEKVPEGKEALAAVDQPR